VDTGRLDPGATSGGGRGGEPPLYAGRVEGLSAGIGGGGGGGIGGPVSILFLRHSLHGSTLGNFHSLHSPHSTGSECRRWRWTQDPSLSH
jgi:hypothetical protein